MLTLRIHHQVLPEFHTVRAWYDARSPLAAAQFSRRFDAAISRIAARPNAHPRWRALFRRARVVRFPYLLLFQISRSVISVLARVHQRRESGAVFNSVRGPWLRFG